MSQSRLDLKLRDVWIAWVLIIMFMFLLMYRIAILDNFAGSPIFEEAMCYGQNMVRVRRVSSYAEFSGCVYSSYQRINLGPIFLLMAYIYQPCYWSNMKQPTSALRFLYFFFFGTWTSQLVTTKVEPGSFLIKWVPVFIHVIGSAFWNPWWRLRKWPQQLLGCDSATALDPCERCPGCNWRKGGKFDRIFDGISIEQATNLEFCVILTKNKTRMWSMCKTYVKWATWWTTRLDDWIMDMIGCTCCFACFNEHWSLGMIISFSSVSVNEGFSWHSQKNETISRSSARKQNETWMKQQHDDTI